MKIQEFLENRDRFPRAELARYRGQWLAFSGDGRRIIARHEDFGALNQLVMDAAILLRRKNMLPDRKKICIAVDELERQHERLIILKRLSSRTQTLKAAERGTLRCASVGPEVCGDE